MYSDDVRDNPAGLEDYPGLGELSEEVSKN